MSLPQMQMPHQSYEAHVWDRSASGRVFADQYNSQGGLRMCSPANLRRHVEDGPVNRKVSSGKPSLIPGSRSMHPWSNVETGKQSGVRLRSQDILSSSGTQMSTDMPLGETSYGPMRIKNVADIRRTKQRSCGSDSLCKLSARPPSSTGTNQTVGSSAVNRGGWTSQNWVAKDSRSLPPYSNPMVHEGVHPCEESVDSRRQSRLQEQAMHRSVSQELTSQESIQQARRGMMDRAIMHRPKEVRQSHVGNLAISPRNQPVHLDNFADAQRQQENLVFNRDHHADKHKDQQTLSGTKPKVLSAELAGNADLPRNSPSPKARLVRPPEWTGLTQNTMELLLKLREEEEVRQLRQRAVTRWLNHLPTPPRKYRGIPEVSKDDEGSCTSIDESTDLDSVHDSPQTPRRHYKSTASPRYNKNTAEKIGSSLSSETQACTDENKDPLPSARGFHTHIRLVKKPEFEFVDHCEEDAPHSGWNQRQSPSAMSDAAFGGRHPCELRAIPEVGSTSDALGDATHDGGSQRPASTVEETAEVFSRDSASSSDEPIRPSRDAACNWRMAMSSLDKWVDAREMVESARKGTVQKISGPDLEAAADSHDNARSQYASMQKRAFEDRMGWCLSDDCDSSRIAVGVQSAEGMKSPRSASQTPKLSTRSSTFSDDGGQKFHLKYSIPEEKAIRDKWAADENCSELMNSTTDLQSAGGTVACETVSEVPLPSPRPGTEYRPSGSLVDSLSVEDECWVKPQENFIPEMVTDSLQTASSAPQATYWLPEFCQNSPMDRSQSTQFHTPRSEPAHWHDNPLSPHYTGMEEKNVNHTAGSRRIDRGTSLVAPDALRNYYHDKESHDAAPVYSDTRMPKLSPRQKLWRHVQQATGRDQSSQHKSGRPNKKRTVSIVKCSRLLSAVTWMCSPRM